MQPEQNYRLFLINSVFDGEFRVADKFVIGAVCCEWRGVCENCLLDMKVEDVLPPSQNHGLCDVNSVFDGNFRIAEKSVVGAVCVSRIYLVPVTE